MTSTTDRAAAALELLSEETGEPAVAYLLEQAEKYRALKQAITEGLEDVQEGRTADWDFGAFLKRARSQDRRDAE
jgi:hypothetical protein